MISLTITRALRRVGLAAGLACAVAAAPASAQTQPAAAGAPAHFTTAELARLCGPAADDANAIRMRPACFASIVMVGQMHSLYTTGRGAGRPAFCMPAETPSLDRVSADFVSWAAANQQYGSTRAAEGLLRFAASAYPCPPARRR